MSAEGSFSEKEVADAFERGDWSLIKVYYKSLGAYQCALDDCDGREKHPRRGWHDPEKEQRDSEKALFKGLFDFYCKERKLDRYGEAFERARAKFPQIDEEVAWYIGPLSKDGNINRLAKTIRNPNVQHERESEPRVYIAPGAPAKKRA